MKAILWSQVEPVETENIEKFSVLEMMEIK